MARVCVNCGKSVGPLSGRMRYRLKDADTWICRKCWIALGFDKDLAATMASAYAWDDIKDGYEARFQRRMNERAAAWDREHSPTAKVIQFANYGQAKDENPTLHEAELFELIRQAIKDNNRDPDALQIVRKSSGYLTAAIDDFDVCRFKFTDRARWIQFPYNRDNKEKRYIEDVALMPDDIEALLKSYDLALANSDRPTYHPNN